MEGTPTRLGRLLAPRSVAIVGASPKPGGARQALANLVELGFPGRLAAVNPRYGEVLGVQSVPRLEDLEFVPDAVLLALPASHCLPVLRSAAELGVGGVVVIATGFAEAGADGRRLQDELRTIAVEAGMPLIGPNCQGTINFALPSALYLRQVNAYAPGSVAVISQSGSVATAIVNNRIGVRVRHVVSSGNEAVTTSADLIAYFVDDPDVRTIVLFQETLRDAPRFLSECDRAMAADKPVIVLKAGRTDEARLAGVSHSGALSPPDRLVDAALSAHGVIRVESLEELLGTALAVGGRRSRGNRVAAVTISGGHVELLLDHAADAGVTMPSLGEATTERLRALLPSALHPSNPLDSWGLTNQEEDFGQCLSLLADDDGIDIVVVMAEPWQHPTGYPEAHRLYIESARELAGRTDKVVVLLSSVSGTNGELVEKLLPDGVLLLAGIRDGLRCLGNLARLTTVREGLGAARASIDAAAVETVLDRIGQEPLSGLAALQLLAGIGIPAVPTEVAETVQAAVSAARAMGGTVVVKSGRQGLIHKLDSGAVALGLAGDGPVGEAATRLLAAGQGPLLVQPMVRGGAEVILGIVANPELGSFVLVGAGGSWAEYLDDTVLAPVPLRAGDAKAMVGRLRMAPALSGGRGQPQLDLDALCRAIEALSAVASASGDRIQSLDVNPIVVMQRGVIALDAVVVPMARADHPASTVG